MNNLAVIIMPLLVAGCNFPWVPGAEQNVVRSFRNDSLFLTIKGEGFGTYSLRYDDGSHYLAIWFSDSVVHNREYAESEIAQIYRSTAADILLPELETDTTVLSLAVGGEVRLLTESDSALIQATRIGFRTSGTT